jgi:RimJ/RimL family protein N-acetyltransferase
MRRGSPVGRLRRAGPAEQRLSELGSTRPTVIWKDPVFYGTRDPSRCDEAGSAAAAVRSDTIRTDRLLMRRWLDSDREPFAALNADPTTMRYFPATLDRLTSDALVDRIESRFEQRGYGLWALEVTDTGEFIGFTGLNPMPDDVPGAGGTEVGWRLARHAWHRGYATEAAIAALDVAFGRLGLNEIWSMTAVLNEPSQALMRRLGLSEVARFDHPAIPACHPLRPHVTYHLASPHA